MNTENNTNYLNAKAQDLAILTMHANNAFNNGELQEYHSLMAQVYSSIHNISIQAGYVASVLKHRAETLNLTAKNIEALKVFNTNKDSVKINLSEEERVTYLTEFYGILLKSIPL